MICNHCAGTGEVFGDACPSCMGAGRILEDEKGLPIMAVITGIIGGSIAAWIALHAGDLAPWVREVFGSMFVIGRGV